MTTNTKNTIEITYATYQMGMSRYSDRPIDYIIVEGVLDGEEIELYAETDCIGLFDENGDWIDEPSGATKKPLWEEILRQSKDYPFTNAQLQEIYTWL